MKVYLASERLKIWIMDNELKNEEWIMEYGLETKSIMENMKNPLQRKLHKLLMGECNK